MKTETFDPEACWKKLLANPEYTAVAPDGPVRELHREFVLTRLADVVGDRMDAPVTAASLLETQCRILRHYVDADFLARLVDALPEQSLGFVGKNGVRAMMLSLFRSLVEQIEQIVPDVPGFLASSRITEEQLLAHPKGGGLSAETMAVWRDGSLTVGGLLMMQPWAVLNFNRK